MQKTYILGWYPSILTKSPILQVALDDCSWSKVSVKAQWWHTGTLFLAISLFTYSMTLVIMTSVHHRLCHEQWWQGQLQKTLPPAGPQFTPYWAWHNKAWWLENLRCRWEQLSSTSHLVEVNDDRRCRTVEGASACWPLVHTLLGMV